MSVTNKEAWVKLHQNLKTPGKSEQLSQLLPLGSETVPPYQDITTRIKAWIKPDLHWTLMAIGVEAISRKTVSEIERGKKMVTGRTGADSLDLSFSFRSRKSAFSRSIFWLGKVDWPSIFNPYFYTEIENDPQSVNLSPHELAGILPLRESLKSLNNPFYLSGVNARVDKNPVARSGEKVSQRSDLTITASFAVLHDYIKLQELDWKRRRLRLEEHSSFKTDFFS